MLVFRPNEIVLRKRRDVLDEATSIVAHRAASDIVLVIDCASLCWDDCVRLWKGSTWSDIRAGYRVFTDMPHKVKKVVVVRPEEEIPYWNKIAEVAMQLMSRKMRSRVQMT